MRTAVLTFLLLSGLLLASADASAQEEPPLLRVSLEPDESRIETAIRDRALFSITVRDESIDDPGRVDGVPPAGLRPHTVEFDVTVENGSSSGWVFDPVSSIATRAGEEHQVILGVLPTPRIEDRIIRVNFTATIRGSLGEPYQDTILLAVETPGYNSLSVTSSSMGDPLQPREIRQGQVTVRNNAQLPRTFGMELVDSSRCGLTLIPSNPTAIRGADTAQMTFTVQAPDDRLWYQNEDCPIGVRIFDVNDPSIEQGTNVGSTVNGWYVDPVWAFWALAIVVAAIILFLFLKRRKQALEEEILGKPQKPWTIPVERVYLEHLEERDERSAYVVRHFLMEEEYQSALLWYKSYKKATRGTRAKERTVVRQENKYKRFQKKWDKRIAAPIKTADRFEAKLQKRLDRKAKKAVRKDRRKWKKLVAKMEGAHEKKKERAKNQWEKAAKKAQKKGQEAPPRPQIAAPDYPDEPQWRRIELADHKWQKKADKFRRKMIKRQGNLEVKYEKKEARLLAKLQRKVRRIARKLDDPDFEREHPIVGASGET